MYNAAFSISGMPINAQLMQTKRRIKNKQKQPPPPTTTTATKNHHEEGNSNALIRTAHGTEAAMHKIIFPHAKKKKKKTKKDNLSRTLCHDRP